MVNLSEHIREREAALNENQGPLTQENNEAQEGIERLKSSIRYGIEKTGVDISSARVKNHEGNIAGQYQVGAESVSSGITIDGDLLEKVQYGELEVKHLRETIVHEIGHLLDNNHQETQIINFGHVSEHDGIEGINQLWTERKMGQKSETYNQETQMVTDFVTATGESIGHVLNLYEQGKTNEINETLAKGAEIRGVTHSNIVPFNQNRENNSNNTPADHIEESALAA